MSRGIGAVPDYRPGGMSSSEFVAYMAALSVTIAVAIDITLPAFDEIKSSFDVPPESNVVALTISLYFLGMGASQLVYGPLSDHFGRKPVLNWGLGLFVLGAAGSMLAPSIGFLLVARLVWGVGAGSPRVLGFSIVRDVYEGDQMARVLSLVMAVFLIGPVVAPLIGQLILGLGSWRVVYGAGLVLGLAVFIWGGRLEETLEDADRRSLGFTRTRHAFQAVLASREAMSYAVATTFVFGILIALLGSTPQIFEVVYEREDQFAVLFSLASAVSAAGAYANSRVVELAGASNVMRRSTYILVAVSALLALVSAVSGGSPSFWLWYALIALLFALVNVLIPTGNALAMNPLGRIAGTAAAVIGAMSVVGGTLLAMIIERVLEDTVTPMSLGFLAYGVLVLTAVLFGAKAEAEHPTPDPGGPPVDPLP